MQKKNPVEIKESIIKTLSKNGPSLPIQIAREISLEPLFTSAFLAELFQEKKIKMTTMRVGSSPVYYLENQEEGLEKYSQYLKSKEKEAYELLKTNRFLTDSEQEPAIRVALRAIKDFANITSEGIWKYYLEKNETPEKTPEKIYEKKNEEENLLEEKSKEFPEKETLEIKSSLAKKIDEENSQKKFKIENKEEEISEGEEFDSKIETQASKLNIKIIEKTQTKKKELSWIGRIENQLGEKEIKIIGKDKKNITEKDIEKTFEIVKEKKKMVVLFSTGELSKKAKEFYREYRNVIFFKKINE